MSSVEDLLQTMSESDYLYDEIQFVIDENLRTIQIPPNGVVLGVRGDKDVNRVNFQMSRYYNGFDMSEFFVRIEFHNARNQNGFYNVNDLSIDGDIIRFTWLVGSNVCVESGTVPFQVYMFKFDENNEFIEQAFRSTIGSGNILEKLSDGEEDLPVEEITDLIGQLHNDIENAKKLINKMMMSLIVINDPEEVTEGTKIIINDVGSRIECPDIQEFNELKQTVGTGLVLEEIDEIFKEVS